MAPTPEPHNWPTPMPHNWPTPMPTPCPTQPDCPPPAPCPTPCPPPPCPTFPPAPTPPPPPGPLCEEPEPVRIFVKGTDHKPRCIGYKEGKIQLWSCGVGYEKAKDQLWLFNHTSSQIVWNGNQIMCLALDTDNTDREKVPAGTKLVLSECESACDVYKDFTRQGFYVESPKINGTVRRNVLTSALGVPSTTPGERDELESSWSTMCMEADDADRDHTDVMTNPCRAGNSQQEWRYLPLMKDCENTGGDKPTMSCSCDCMWSAHCKKKDCAKRAKKEGAESCCQNCCCNQEWEAKEACVHKPLGTCEHH